MQGTQDCSSRPTMRPSWFQSDHAWPNEENGHESRVTKHRGGWTDWTPSRKAIWKRKKSSSRCFLCHFLVQAYFLVVNIKQIIGNLDYIHFNKSTPLENNMFLFVWFLYFRVLDPNRGKILPLKPWGLLKQRLHARINVRGSGAGSLVGRIWGLSWCGYLEEFPRPHLGYVVS